jgi:tubulin monoglycylase TTLL3/8
VVSGTERVTHKGNLARLLRARGLAAELQPETFLVDDDPAELEALRARARAEPDAVWIKKPVGRGSGIGVAPIPDVERWLAQRSAAPPIEGAELVQRYIEQPLLLHGTKSEIRSYLLVASTDPLRVLYHDGSVRLTSLPFHHGDWDNPLVHVTNTYRQKRADPARYRAHGTELKWSLEDLGRDVLARGLTDDPRWLDDTLRPALIALAHHVVRALAPRITRGGGGFQLLGMDTILDADLQQVWLTEIQQGPGLALDGPVKARLVPAMLEEAMDIVLEARDERHRGDPAVELGTRRRFQWVYRDETTQRRTPASTVKEATA